MHTRLCVRESSEAARVHAAANSSASSLHEAGAPAAHRRAYQADTVLPGRGQAHHQCANRWALGLGATGGP